MRAMALLAILLLTMGLWSAPVMAGDNTVIQQLPASCQPVTDAELSQMNGKGRISLDLCRIAQCIYSNLPPDTQRKVACVVQVVRCFTRCGGNNTTPGFTIRP
jgi:hypothetical protein